VSDVREPDGCGVAASNPRATRAFHRRSNRCLRTGHQVVRAENKVEEGVEWRDVSQPIPVTVEVALFFAPARRPGPPSRTGCLLFPKQAGCRLPRPSHRCDQCSVVAPGNDGSRLRARGRGGFCEAQNAYTAGTARPGRPSSFRERRSCNGHATATGRTLRRPSADPLLNTTAPSSGGRRVPGRRSEWGQNCCPSRLFEMCSAKSLAAQWMCCHLGTHDVPGGSRGRAGHRPRRYARVPR